MIGPGKYNKETTELRLKLKAKAIFVAVIDGEQGHGFSLQSEPGYTAALPAVLRKIAETIEKDLQPNPQN